MICRYDVRNIQRVSNIDIPNDTSYWQAVWTSTEISYRGIFGVTMVPVSMILRPRASGYSVSIPQNAQLVQILVIECPDIKILTIEREVLETQGPLLTIPISQILQEGDPMGRDEQ